MGGAGGDGGAGGSGGTGGTPVGSRRYVVEFGSCNPELAKPLCLPTTDRFPDVYRCVERDGAWVWEGENCTAQDLTCENDNPECIRPPEDPRYCAQDWCVPGEQRCATEAHNKVGKCKYIERDVMCDTPRWDIPYAFTCDEGEVCREGACEPTCNTVACACPDTYAPSCAADGRIYWNPCYRACAGELEGVGCEMDEALLVARTPTAMLGFAALDPPVVLSGDFDGEDGYGHHRSCTWAVGSDGDGFAFDQLDCDDQGLGRDIEVVRTQDGWLTLGHLYDGILGYTDGRQVRRLQTLMQVVSGNGEAMFEHDATIYLAMSHRLATIQPGANGDVDIRYEQTYETIDDEEVPGHTTNIGLLGDRLAYAMGSGSRLDVFEILDDPVRRSPLARLGIETASYAFTRIWTSGTDSAVTGYALTLRGGELMHRLTDDVWRDGCFERRAHWTFVTEDLRQGWDVRPIRLSPDAAPGLVWSTGPTTFILGRAPNGFLHVRAAISIEGAESADAVPIDLDGDGLDELAVLVYMSSDPLERQPPGPIYRITPRAPLTPRSE